METELKKLKEFMENLDIKGMPIHDFIKMACSDEGEKYLKLKTEQKLYVFVNGFGLRPFKATREEKLPRYPAQYIGKYKLPKGVKLGSGSRWVDLDYYFDENQIYVTKESAYEQTQYKTNGL